MIQFVPIDSVQPEAIERLLDEAFGTDRHRRTAYRIREGTQAVPALSFAALADGETLVGSIQCWPVELRCDGGPAVPLVMVGPIAVAAERQHQGIGRALTAHALAAADAQGHKALMLIGDPEYYGRFFGFTAERTGGWRVPGPVERRRLLARGPAVPECAGELAPRVAAIA